MTHLACILCVDVSYRFDMLIFSNSCDIGDVMNTVFQTGKERHRKEVTLYPRGWGLLPPAPQTEELRAEEAPAIKVTE